MKKVLATMAGFGFGAFGVGIIALMMSLTYQALGKIFPNHFTNQMWGMIIYDIAVICWAGAFVFKSKSIVQYSAAGTGFIIALIGTLGMVGAEVMLSGQKLVPTQTQQIGQWMVYGFIGVTILHVLLLWTHHGAAPEIWAQIDTGISKSQVTDTARKKATKQIDEETNELADTIAADMVAEIKRDLNLTPVKGTPFDLKRAETPAPVLKDESPATPDPFPIADSPSGISGTPAEPT